mmetsp:Transcript_33068/g.50728  ORF Transcript_33068/g.50728 Transcript_33068/m.50728 type:complete len:99 (-) Transcript_33068:22-318(-)
MKRVNYELSPFRDKETYDENYIRFMWTRYTQLKALREGSTPKKISQDLPQVAAFVRGLQDGPESFDSKTLSSWAEGDLTFEDKQVRDYYIKQLQKRRT